MRINHKQQELIDKFFNDVKKKFPEIIFKDLSVSPDDPDHIWINVIADMDENREYELRDYSVGIETEIDNDFGYRISLMTENPSIVLY